MFNFLSSKKANWSEVEVSIIVSTGRTGTKFFFSIADQIQDCLAKHEPKPVGNIEGAKFLRGELNSIELEKFLLTARYDTRKELGLGSFKNYFESNGGLTFYVNMLHKIFPKLRIAHIIRDPRDFVRSACSRVDAYGNRRSLNGKNWLFKSKDLPQDKYFSDWEKMDMPERFMWIWNLKNKYVLNSSNKFEHIKTFRFEDLMRDSKSKIEMLDFLLFNRYTSKIEEVIHNEQKHQHNATSSFLFPEYENWSSELKTKLDLHCGDLMKNFNYC